ncbi:hypothetical protein ACWN8V_07570 [Vagococcus elongatus]|uniref:Uncharacterized protein n=1 Tax=Vagococcus elongatus TaxID=180344 RepID=A0A430AU51_9ENTE|nr:hypothetical protein [Vagococcus elongatus]RSU11583.1 hypothetical protein CBF29_07840 [Vagococcus elongatus]
MDYDAFFKDVAMWINQSNQNQLKFGFGSDEFWEWVMFSSGEICNKYENKPIVLKQFNMLLSWLDEAYQNWKR